MAVSIVNLRPEVGLRLLFVGSRRKTGRDVRREEKIASYGV
jgi:hypothetical protein